MKFKTFKIIKKYFSFFIFHLSPSGGQALITFLFFIAISVSIMTAAAIIIFTSSASASMDERGTIAYYLAESGVENAALRLLRDPLYRGETLSFTDGTVEIVVAGSPPVITSSGKAFNSIKKLRAETLYENNKLTISSWKEAD